MSPEEAAFEQYGSKAEAARALGIPVTTFKDRLARAIEGQFNPPPGHVIKGISALLDQEGRVKAQWVKTREGEIDLEAAIREAFDGYKGHAVLPPSPKLTNADLTTFYTIADHHLGLYAWDAEAGANYDLRTGEQILLKAMGELVASAPGAEEAVVLNLGDFFHADNPQNRTERSGNTLDVDTRYAKVLSIGVKLIISCIELALQKHKHVTARMLGGNHDPNSSLALGVALQAFFDGNERVTIDCSPSKFFKWQWGKVMVSATHGDTVKPKEMPGLMAARWPKDWGQSDYRYAYLGHVHHMEKGGEENGVKWEVFQTLAAKDAWHAGRSWCSGRSMTAITHHKEYGEHFRHTVAISPL